MKLFIKVSNFNIDYSLKIKTVLFNANYFYNPHHLPEVIIHWLQCSGPSEPLPAGHSSALDEIGRGLVLACSSNKGWALLISFFTYIRKVCSSNKCKGTLCSFL